VTLVNTMSNETLDEAGVKAKFGVPPGRIVDYLALIGDTVDNVPGVDKVGPKTAVKWLKRIRHARQPDRARGRDQGRGRREPARGARLAAEGAASWSRSSAMSRCR
jgi:5'-3' exonuclease